MKRLALLSLVFLLSFPAHAIKLSVAGLGNFAKPEGTGNQEAKMGKGYGAFLEIGFLPMIGLELGALQLERKYAEKNGAGAEVTTSFRGNQFPALLRANLGFISFGLGGYYMKYQNSVTREQNNNGVITGSTLSYSAAGLTTTDFGLASSLRLTMELAPFFKLFGEGRYNMGLKDNDPGTAETKFTEMTALAGLQVGF